MTKLVSIFFMFVTNVFGMLPKDSSNSQLMRETMEISKMRDLKKEIFKNLYQFSTYIPQMDFTIHQYLLVTEPAILFAAGTVQQAGKTLPEIQQILGDKLLKYIFVSHFESDEAAGIKIFQKAYPGVTVICSHLATRELFGFGYKVNILPKKGGEFLEDGELKLQFIDYPSEVHLQNGLVVSEMNRGIFYSADLMLSFGNGIGKTKAGDWKKEVEAISPERVPNEHDLWALKDFLLKISPKFVAVGHGYCINCEQIRKKMKPFVFRNLLVEGIIEKRSFRCR